MLQLSGTPAEVAAARAALRAAASTQYSSAPSSSPIVPVCASCGPQPTTPGMGALAAQSSCATTGLISKMNPLFCAYTAQAPLYVVNVPTRNQFDVPQFTAISYFGRVARVCASEQSIMGTLTLGVPGCSGTQVLTDITAEGTAVDIVAEPGCDVYTPGLLIGVGFSNNTPPGVVNISVNGVGEDGCPFEMDDIRVSLNQMGQGQLMLLFGCVEQQRLYPVIARLRTDVELLPAGTVLPGGALGTALTYPNTALHLTIAGPSGTTITLQTLTWNMPALSCVAEQAVYGQSGPFPQVGG